MDHRNRPQFPISMIMIDPVKGSQEWASYTMFKDFLFPKSLYHKTKREEVEELKALGYGQGAKKGVDLFHPSVRHAVWPLFPMQECHERGCRHDGSFCRIRAGWSPPVL